MNEGYQHLTRRHVADFLQKRIADKTPSVVVFASDMIPIALAEETQPQGTLIRRYLDAGGKIVWPGNVPLVLRFDPTTFEIPQLTPKDLERSKRVLGVDENNVFEADAMTRATRLGRRWGLPTGWWLTTGPIAAPPGSVDVLATDEHGHAAAWVKRYGGPEGTGFVRFWGRERRLPDPRVALALAEYGLS